MWGVCICMYLKRTLFCYGEWHGQNISSIKCMYVLCRMLRKTWSQDHDGHKLHVTKMLELDIFRAHTCVCTVWIHTEIVLVLHAALIVATLWLALRCDISSSCMQAIFVENDDETATDSQIDRFTFYTCVTICTGPMHYSCMNLININLVFNSKQPSIGIQWKSSIASTMG